MTATLDTPPITAQAESSPPRRRWWTVLARTLPVGLRDDIVYLWATFRLRHRPLKMLGLIFLLGTLCWVWETFGLKYLEPPLGRWIALLPPGNFQIVLDRTSRAIFSSLNMLSCASIVIMSRSLRRLLGEGHLEMLQLTPRQIRPSALYYAIGSRYIVLALIAILAMYLDPHNSPFKRFPFVLGRASVQYDQIIGDPWLLRWVAIHEFSIYVFCPVNVFMDLVTAFWIFCRWRLTLFSTILAVVVIGLLSPVVLMSIHEWISNEFRTSPYLAVLRDNFLSHNYGMMSNSVHYLSTSVLSFLVAMALLIDLDYRWLRIMSSPTQDPVFIRKMD